MFAGCAVDEKSSSQDDYYEHQNYRLSTLQERRSCTQASLSVRGQCCGVVPKIYRLTGAEGVRPLSSAGEPGPFTIADSLVCIGGTVGASTGTLSAETLWEGLSATPPVFRSSCCPTLIRAACSLPLTR